METFPCLLRNLLSLGAQGVKADEVESDDLVEEVRNLPNSEQQVQSEEFCTLLRQQKYLKNLTEHALKKNQPLIILNLMHEKTASLSAEELTGTERLERMCLQTLSMRPLPGFPDIEISTHNDVVDEDQEAFSAKLSTKLPATAAALVDSDLPQIVSYLFCCRFAYLTFLVQLLYVLWPGLCTCAN